MYKFARFLLILNKLPTAPSSVDLNTLYSYLDSMGFKCSKRTLQRDIGELEFALRGQIIISQVGGHGGFLVSFEPRKIAFLKALPINNESKFC